VRIGDMITGKLDVREAAVRLPEETEELEPLDETDTFSFVAEEETDEIELQHEVDVSSLPI